MLRLNLQVVKVYTAFIFLSNTRVSAPMYENAYAIESFLLKNYSTSILPVDVHSDRVYVHVDVYLMSIPGLNELTGQMTTTLGLSLFWNDSQLTWDPTLFGGLPSIDIASSKVWTPDIVLANAGRKVEILGEERSKLFVFRNGSASWVIMDVMYSVCDVDVTYFPFDMQVCHAEFITWAYKRRFHFRVSKSEVDLSFFTENGVWSLHKTNVKTFFYESEHSPQSCSHGYVLPSETIYVLRHEPFGTNSSSRTFKQCSVSTSGGVRRARRVFRNYFVIDYSVHDDCSGHVAGYFKTRRPFLYIFSLRRCFNHL